MESILRRTEIVLETLNPQSQKFSAFSSYAPRRSHLDSASYRSLVRILSRCLDHSLVPPPAPVERTLDVINPNLNGGTPMEGQEKCDRCSDGGGHEGSLVAAAELVGIDPALFDDEFEASVNSDLLSRFMSDCERLIDVPNLELPSSGELHEEKVQVDHMEIVDKDVEITKTCIKEASEVAKGDANSECSNGMPDSDSLIGEPNSELCSIVQSHVGNGQSGQQEIVDNDLGILKVCALGAVPQVSDLEEVLKVSKEDANNKLLSRVLPDCNRTFDVPNGELCSSGESHEANEKTDHKQIVENGFKITEAFFHDAEKGNFKPGEVSTVTKGDANNELLKHRVIDAPNRKLHLTFESHDENGQSVLEEIAGNDPGITKVSVLGTQEEFSNIAEISEVFKGDGSHVLLNKVILDGSRLIDAPNGELQSIAGPHDRNVQGCYEKIMDNDMISKALVYGAKDGISDLGKILGVVEEDELGRIQPNVPVSAHNSMKESEGRRKTTGDVGDEKIEVIKQTTYAKSPSLMDWSDVRNLEEDQVNTLVHQIDEGCFEEGEIPDEIQDLEGQIDFNDEERVQGPTKNDFKEVASTSTFVHKKDVLEHGTGYQPSTVKRRAAVDNEANPSDTSENDSTDEETHKKQMVMNAREKQRGPLTEERKAKKKIAKKRKRAQKNREQGVKKLKLHTITKPKEVKICNFYLMGRCQQGDLCKYSHDAPLIKSAPCKYFASNSCLKGDDCMFDHELSKYPCHKYASTGSCIRGDGCKFSHKIPNTEASAQAHLTSEPPKLTNQPVRAHVSPRAAGPFESSNKVTRPLGRPPLKEATQVPKGIRFLSFGAVQTDLNNKVKEKLPVKKSGKNGVYNQQRQHGCADSSNGFAVKNSCSITQMSSLTAPGTVNHEVSEATKILEEFLFCGAT